MSKGIYDEICRRFLSVGNVAARSYEAEFLNFAVSRLPDVMELLRLEGAGIDVLPIVFVETSFAEWVETALNKWRYETPCPWPALLPAGKVNTWKQSSDYKVVDAKLRDAGLTVNVRMADVPDVWQCRGWDVYPCTLYPVFLKGYVFDGLLPPPPRTD